jgi:hypothetical protein
MNTAKTTVSPNFCIENFDLNYTSIVYDVGFTHLKSLTAYDTLSFVTINDEDLDSLLSSYESFYEYDQENGYGFEVKASLVKIDGNRLGVHYPKNSTIGYELKCEIALIEVETRDTAPGHLSTYDYYSPVDGRCVIVN